MEDEAMQTAPEPPNKSPNSELSPHPAKIREEGELSSDDDDETTVCSVPHSTASSVPTSGAMLVPPMNKFTQGTQEGKALCGNVLASSADIRSQTSVQPTSQKISDKNRIPLKSATPGWRAPLGANDDLVIRFSDDDSDSGEKEHRIEKAMETKSHVTGVVANGKPPTSSFARSNILRQTARNVDKVMPKKMSMNLSRERGYDQGVGLNSSKLQDLRQQIALRESELKLKSAQRTKESITHEASKSSARYSDVIEREPKEPEKKRMKVGGSFSTQLSALGPQDIPVAKSTLSSKLPAVENNNPPEMVKIDHGQKGIPIGPTESSIVKSKSQNDKHVAGAGIDTKCIQSSGRSKMVDLYDTLNQGTSQEIMTCNNLPKNLNTLELNHTNGDGGHLEPGSFLEKSTSGKNLMRSADHQEVIASDKKLDPSYNICQASLNNASLWNCFGNANVTANGDIHSLVEMEENLDKDLEEAQEHRRRCEIEEKNALKAYRKAQRDLLQANVRCTDLYRQRELYSANLRSFIMDNSSLIWSSRQNEQAGIGLDLANNVSENVDLIPTSGHLMHPEDDGCNPAACDSNIQCVNNARIHTSYKHLSEQNMGTEPCSEPDSSASEPVPLLGNNGADGICSPSNELNNSADEDEDEARFSFENESVQPNVLCHKNTDFGNKKKEIDKESNRKMSIDSPQDPVLLERMLRSKLFATLGTKTLSKNSSSCNNTEVAVERGAENDVRSEKSQENKGSFPISEGERNHEGTDGQEKSSSEAPLEIQREHSVENISVNSHSNSYSEDRLYLSGNIMRSTFGYMKVICPKDLIEHQTISQQSPTCINSEKVQFSNIMVEPLKETLVKLARREVGTYSTGPAIDPFWPLCMYELRGKCNNDECPWQHVKDYSNTNMHQHQHDNSGTADCQVGLTLHQKKCDDSTKVPCAEKWSMVEEVFQPFLSVSNLFRKDVTEDFPFLHGNDGHMEFPSQLTQALADNDQYLEMALLIFSQEANELEGLRKALPVLSRALEADPTSIILWIFYLLIYYSNMKSVGKDDMFSCAVKYNDRSYELWLMCINSRMQLDDRLVTYDVALSALCRHATASDIDGTKLPDAVVRQFECQKELFEIEWPSIQLMDDEKQRATMLMETVVDSVDSYMKIESLEKTRTHKHDLGDSHFERFEEALSNWPKEVPGVQCIWNQYVEYALQNGRYDFGKEVMDRWFRSVWKVHDLQIGTLDEMNCDNSDRSQGLASNSIKQTFSSNPKQMDIMFGYLNLSLHNLLQNDHSEARLALDRALNAAVPEYFKHCVREHALFMLTDESLLKENGSISGIQKILEQYFGDAPAFSTSEPLSRKFVNNIKKPRVRQLVSNVFSPLSSDFSVVNSVLEVWYGPSLLPEKFSEQKNMVDFVEAILT
ncbi:uncharacterized protein Pyn_16936 [Prunus yedoensis var. nudiflora]|uniref:Putative zinc-finger domain-containing protein n=1 Tax=Prunus yedoensis var. nudiflora TaxID=2094558 RepID=A0A314UY01_PRUYE|nr:uncharacterized protein Pyn_16936 [Prunus yedoensis var. nudiflora]